MFVIISVVFCLYAVCLMIGIMRLIACLMRVSLHYDISYENPE